MIKKYLCMMMTLFATLSAETQTEAECVQTCKDRAERCYSDCAGISPNDEDCPGCSDPLSNCEDDCADPKVKNQKPNK